jgi:hypothetical protein
MGSDSARRIAKSLIEDNRNTTEFEVKFWDEDETRLIEEALKELGCRVVHEGSFLKITPPQTNAT